MTITGLQKVCFMGSCLFYSC